MKSKNIFAIFAFAISMSALRATITYRPHTAVDRLTYYNPGKLIPAYMREHGLSGDEMLALLQANIAEHLKLASPGNTKEIAASISVGAIEYSGADLPVRLDAIGGYAKQAYPELIRNTAMRAHLHAGKLLSLPFASNVMTQTWRTHSEHDNVRFMFYNMAKSAAPEEREKYVEFFKWAVGENYIGGAIDDNLLELEPSWRSNALRRVALGKLMHFKINETGTNNVLAAIRDYEVAAGLHNADAPRAAPPPSAAAQTNALQTNALQNAAVQSAVAPASPTASARAATPAIAATPAPSPADPQMRNAENPASGSSSSAAAAPDSMPKPASASSGTRAAWLLLALALPALLFTWRAIRARRETSRADS